MNRWVRDKWGVGVEFIEAPVTGWGVRNAYLNPYRLGADRWAALVAARQLTKEHVYLVDAGTALTIDVMGADGTHQGGLIVPGLGLMRQVLVDRAAGIRLERAADSASATSLLARDTSGAVNGGTLYGAVAFVDRVRQDVESELGAALRCIITGGDAEKLLPLLSGNFEYHEHLVLRGLAVIATERA
jgi:type III pantothenate kinase